MTSVSRPGSRSPGSSRSRSVRLACVRPGSTMNRSPAMKAVMSESRDSREDIPGPNGRERGDQSRKHPQAHQQRHRDVRHEVDLQTAQLLQTQRPRRVGRNRKQSIGRQAGHEARGRRDRVSGDLQDVEQALPAFDADQRDAQNEGEQHHGGHDVVRQGIERVRGNVEIDEVERRAAARRGSS